MQVSAAFPPSPESIDHAILAEKLGFHRAWFYDSPALYADIWVTMARVADRTNRIGLGTAVLIPNLRHPMTTAAAIATLEQQAPGRLAVAFGTGFTGRMAMGQKPLTWAHMRRYLRQVRALLAGEIVAIEGAQTQMIHPPGFVAERPVRTPLLIGANGPKGLEVAHELGGGVVCLAIPRPGFDWCSVLTFGTVLDDGESPSSERVLETAGPAFAAFYHSGWSESLPRGDEWRAMIEQFPPETRHLKTHELHLVGVSNHDRPYIDPAAAAAGSFTGTKDQLRGRMLQMAAGGATELLWQPAGPDIERELHAFANMAQIG